MHNYKELKIWQRSREIVKDVYSLTTTFPAKEQYGITSQLCRAVISIPSNIAEGAGRESEKEFAHFLAIANGSAFELETQLYLCFDLNYITEADLNDLLIKVQEIQRMIFRFKQQLKIS